MKRFICIVIALALLLCLHATAESLDLSGYTAEQLEALQQAIDTQLDSKRAQAPMQYSDCISLLNAMIDAGAAIDPDKITDLTAENDPNGLLGTEGSYSSKTDFGCVGYAATADGYVGGTIEYFPDPQRASARFDYIKQIYISMPLVADQSMYLADKYVLRLDLTLGINEVTAIVAKFEEQLGTTVADVFDPNGKISYDTLRGIDGAESADLEAADYIEAQPTAVPSAPPVPTSYQTLQRGMKGTEVAKLQTRLKQIGFLDGLADGSFGPATEKAVRAFQAANRLDETGIATPEHQAILFNYGAVCADGSIAKAYGPFEICPIELSNVDLKKAYGYNYVTFKAKNISTEDVKAVSCCVRYCDAFGDRISEYGVYEYVVQIADIAAGESASVSTSDDYTLLVSNAATAEVAVVRVMLGDGTDIEYDDPVWLEGK